MAREGAGEEARRRESWWDEGVTRAGVESKVQSREGCPPMVFNGGGEDGGRPIPYNKDMRLSFFKGSLLFM